MVFNDSQVRVSERRWNKPTNMNTNTQSHSLTHHQKEMENKENETIYLLFMDTQTPRIHPYITWINTKLSSNYDDHFHILKLAFFTFVFQVLLFFSLLHFLYEVFCVVVGFFPLVLHIVWFILHCFIFFSVFHVRCVISIRCKFKKWISTASKRPCLKTLKIAGLWQWYSDIERCTNGNVRSLASLCLWVCAYFDLLFNLLV